MSLEKSLLFHFVRDALGPYSEDFRILTKQNPTKLLLNQKPYSTHVSYVHDSGNARDNEDEVRIQIARSLIETQRERNNDGYQASFVGFFEGGKAFVAWDPRHVFSLQAKTVVSVYARQSQLSSVEANLAAVHSFKAKFLDETSFAIALPANALGIYLENIEHFHRLPSEAAVRSVLASSENALAESGVGFVGEYEATEGDTREKFTYERKAYPRDPRFAKAVLNAYEKTCCICGRQLGLVQAAHIIPHSEPDCPNDVSNGLALCIEHHRLYDDALLLPAPEGKLVYNENRAEYLSETGQGNGLDGIKAIATGGYTLPKAKNLRPSDDFLQRGIDIRLGD